MSRALARRAALASALSGVLLTVSGCGGDVADDSNGEAGDTTASAVVVEPKWTEPPVGRPLLPDFAPLPPLDVHTKESDDGWVVEFSSTLVNVGEGDFHATAARGPVDSWIITQDIEHEQGGAEQVATMAEVVWAGDGHEHWHVERYVVYHLSALDEQGEPTGEQRTDHKVGFCIYDFEKADVDMGPDEPVYRREGCGREDSTKLVMGLSPGWADYYKWSLPGQSIDIDGLADGTYRLFAVADEARVFRESSTDNNQTWVDFELATNSDGLRLATVGEVGPSPQ